jgi:hypothetical protein
MWVINFATEASSCYEKVSGLMWDWGFNSSLFRQYRNFDPASVCWIRNSNVPYISFCISCVGFNVTFILSGWVFKFSTWSSKNASNI